MELTKDQISELQKQSANKYDIAKSIENLLQFRQEVVGNYNSLLSQINDQITKDEEKFNSIVECINNIVKQNDNFRKDYISQITDTKENVAKLSDLCNVNDTKIIDVHRKISLLEGKIENEIQVKLAKLLQEQTREHENFNNFKIITESNINEKEIKINKLSNLICEKTNSLEKCIDTLSNTTEKKYTVIFWKISVLKRRMIWGFVLLIPVYILIVYLLNKIGFFSL